MDNNYYNNSNNNNTNSNSNYNNNNSNNNSSNQYSDSFYSYNNQQNHGNQNNTQNDSTASQAGGYGSTQSSIYEGTPGEVSGGKLTHLTGNLYLLQAKKPTVTIEKLED